MKVLPFKCIRPSSDKVEEVASLPYDVYSREEARNIVKNNPLAYLGIERPDANFDDEVASYEDIVYKKSSELLEAAIDNGVLIEDTKPQYYVYVQVFKGREQKGIVAKCSLEDYLSNKIKKHELTREDKEKDRVRNILGSGCQTGPIFLAFKEEKNIEKIINKTVQKKPIYDFVSIDEVEQRIFEVEESDNETIRRAFEDMKAIYVADGHHRIKAASTVYEMKKRNELEGTKETDYVLAVLFAQNQLEIMDYNRVVADLNGFEEKEFLDELSKIGGLSKVKGVYKPEHKGVVGVYLGSTWYKLELLADSARDVVGRLDCSLLQDLVLAPLLGIDNPRTNPRIDFIGGIRGLKEIERRCHKDMKVGFSLYPTQMSELFEVADNDLLMPPKSTWFEPKLQSGIFTRRVF